MNRIFQILSVVSLLPLFAYCYGNSAGPNGPLHCWKLQDQSMTLICTLLIFGLAGASFLPLGYQRALQVGQFVAIGLLLVICLLTIGHGETGHDWSLKNIDLLQNGFVFLVSSFIFSLISVVVRRPG